ncbi:MAG TPA: asparagine synthase-related protein [Solirubrobacteraceae bacterium]|nr:asparagine synthase-related protein [Solirubrobacteraceae bacterium]
MLCGAWSRSGDRRPPVAGETSGDDGEAWRDGPLTIFSGDPAARASAGDLACFLEGRLSPPAGHPTARAGRPQADAEVVLRAWRDEGAAGVAALRGQFSAVIWEAGRRRLHLVCERLARQGWYALERSGELLFATELRDLVALAPSRPDPDPLSFTMWLGGLGCPEGRTLYAGVSRLGPGESFAYSGASIERRTHWRPTYQPPRHAPRGELAAELREQLRDSTWQYVSPGVTGVILSGGIDSSIVAATAAEGQGAGIDVRTYSAIFPGEPYDESDKIRALTDRLGIRGQAIQPAPVGSLWLALRHLQEWGVPLVAPGALMEMSVTARAAADGADVVLDGQTGDEILGFAPYLLADRLAQGRLLAVERLLRSWPAGRAISWRQRARVLRTYGVKGAAPYRLGRFVRDHRDRSGHGPKWLIPSRRQTFREFEDAWEWKARYSGPRWWKAFVDTAVWGPHRELRLEYLRQRASTAGMRWGSPLYDERLIDFCARLDPRIAFNQPLNRPLVREALSDLLPDVVRNQTRKANFSAFAAQSIVSDEPGLHRLLQGRDLEIAAYIDLEWIRERWRPAGERLDPMHPFWGVLWRAAIGQAWLRYGSDPSQITEMAGDPAISPPRAEPADLVAH